MCMNKDVFHYKCINYFFNKYYSNTIRLHEIRSDESVIKEIVGWKDNKPIKEDREGFSYKQEKDKKTLFILSDDVKYLPARVKHTRKMIHRGKVYHIIDEWDKRNIVPDNCMTVKEWIDSIAPLNHTNPSDFLSAKLVIATGTLTRQCNRIATKQGFGKDAIANQILNITNDGRSVTEVSNAKLMQLPEYNFTFFNELAGISSEAKYTLQRLFFDVGDYHTPWFENVTTGSEKTKTRVKINNYGITIFHNTPDYYITKGESTFEDLFTDAIFYRIIPFYFEGSINDKQFSNKNIDVKKVVEDNLIEYINFVKYFKYLKSIFNEIVLKYDISKYHLITQDNESNSRWSTGFHNIAKLVQEYSESEQEFYKLMDNIYKSHYKYIDLLKDNGYLSD